MRASVIWKFALSALLMLPMARSGADEPVPQPEQTKPLVYSEQLDAWETLERDGLMKAYLASGTHAEDRDKSYTAFIRAYAHVSVHDSMPRDAARIRDACVKLIKSGFEDPLLRAVGLEGIVHLTRALKKLPRVEDIKNAEGAVAILKERGYPPVRIWIWTRTIAISKALAKMDRTEIAASVRQSEEAFVAAAVDAATNPFLEQHLIRLLSLDMEDKWAVRYTTNFPRLLAESAASPWMKGTASGIWHAENAWKLRGDDYGTDDAQRAGFEEELDIAEACLTDAFRADPTRPEPAARLIQVRGGHLDQAGVSLWFEMASKAQIDYLRAYDWAIWFQRPRWGGSHEKMIAFAERCLATNRFDTLVPGRYLKALAAIGDDKEDFGNVLSRPGVAENLERIRRGYTGSNLIGGSFASSQVALCYWRLGRFADAKALYDEMGARFDTETLAEWRLLPEEFAQIHAYAPATRDLVQSADRAIQDGHPENSTDLLTEALAAAPDDPARKAIRMKVALNHFNSQYTSGQWTPIASEPDANLLFTVGSVNQGWEFKPENRVTVNPKPWYAMTVFLPKLGPNWEIRGTVIMAPGNDNQDFCAGVSLYVNTEVAAEWDSWTWQDVLIFPELRLWRLGPPHEEKKPINVGASRFALRIQCWQNELIIKVDGENALAGERPFVSQPKAADRLALHVIDCTPRPDAVTFDSFEVRKLNQRPAELENREKGLRDMLRPKF